MSNELFEKILYCIFPRRCALCGDVIPFDEIICDDCKLLSKITNERCLACGREKNSCTCKKAKHKPDYESIIAPYYYDEKTQKGIHRLKFYVHKELAQGMANSMIECINNEYNDISFDAITFIPMSKAREKARGYNQSYLLAEYISNALDIPLENTFYKAYENPPQRNQSARQRRANVFGAFDINESINPEEKTYLIVDDIKTTGATLNECAAVLDSYGAKATYVVAFAIR